MAITKANYLPVASGRARRLSRCVHYYTWRGTATDTTRRSVPRGWVCDNDQALTWRAVRENVRADEAVYRYAYRLVLSTARTALATDEYRAVLGRHFGRWYLVTHHDGSHPHAHVIGFTDQRLGRGDLASQRQRLQQLEQQHERRW